MKNAAADGNNNLLHAIVMETEIVMTTLKTEKAKQFLLSLIA